MNTHQKSLNYLWLIIFTLLTLFVGGRWNIPLAAWLAPIFAIRFYRDSERGGRAFLWLWLAATVSTTTAWYGATALNNVSPVAEPIFFLVMAPIALIPNVIDRLYHRRWRRNGNHPFWLTFIFPISLTAVDFFSASGSPFGSFGAIAYSQTGFTALMQLTAVTGMWSIPFIIGWSAAVVNYAWEQGFVWAKFQRGALIFAGVLALIFGFGVGRTAVASPAPQEVQIGGFSLPENELHAILSLTQQDEEASFREAVSTLHTQLLAQAQLMAQEGAEIVLEHYKYGGTQFEGSVTGSGELQTVATPYGTLSAVICWDADFPENMKQAGEQEVDLLFIPSNDWHEIRDLHAGMATFRAVENGVPIYRQTGAGVSVVTDAYGQVLNRIDIFEEENDEVWAAVQIVPTQVGSINTIYPKIGDAFWHTDVGWVGRVNRVCLD